MRIDMKIPSIFIRAISIILVSAFITSQVSASHISSNCSSYTLAASVVSDQNINPERSDVVRNDIAKKAEPGAIGNGAALMNLVIGKLPPRTTLSSDDFDRIAVKLNPAITSAIWLSVAKEKNIPPKHQKRFKQALDNLIDLQNRLKTKAYLFNADIRAPEDYLVGFNFNEKIGLSLELIDRLHSISTTRLAQYIFHECVPEKGIIIGMDDHRVVYEEIQSVVFGEDEVLALKKDLRGFINGEVAGKASETPGIATEQTVSKISANQIKLGNTNIGIVKRDITKVSSDAVVVGVYTSTPVVDMWGVTAKIVSAVGKRNVAKVFPPPQVAIGKNRFKIGDVYTASLGNIRTAAGWKYVISAVIYDELLYFPTTYEGVRISTKNALIEANKVGVRSITLPAFETGLFGIDHFNTAEISMYAGIKEFLTENPKTSITDIKVVFSDRPSVKLFRRELARPTGTTQRNLAAAKMPVEGAVTTTVQAPVVSNYFEGISEDLPVRAKDFAFNLTRISRILAEHPGQSFFVGIETDIGESQKAQIMPIYKAIDQIENMTDNNTGKRLFPNLIVRRAKAGELVTMVRDLNKEGKLNLNNAFIGARKINVDNKAYDAIKGEGRAWISAIDDSRPGDYLPVFEAITMNMMAYLNADLSAIKKFYDAISDEPIDPGLLQDYIKNRIIYILPKATAFDTKQLRELYELAHQVYIAA